MVQFFLSVVMVQMSAESAKTNGLLEFPEFQEHVWTQPTVLKSLCNCKCRLPHVNLCSGSMFNGLLGTSSISTLFRFFSYNLMLNWHIVEQLLVQHAHSFVLKLCRWVFPLWLNFFLIWITQQFVVLTTWDHTCYKSNGQVYSVWVKTHLNMNAQTYQYAAAHKIKPAVM